MKKSSTLACLVTGVMASGAMLSTVHGQSSDALLQALIKKGILTDQEAEDIKSDLHQENRDVSKFKVTAGLQSLTLYGDARLRYEWREAQNNDDDTNSRERFRYRVRFGLKGQYKDNWYYGFQLETSTSSRSTNVTFGDDGGGPSAKNSDQIGVGLVYVGWNATEWLNLEAGKMANPILTSSMVWDGDLNPEGAAQRFKVGLLEDDQLTLFATFGQFLYDDRNPENSVGGGGGDTLHDAFLLAWQVGAKYQFNTTMSAQIAPVLYNYTGHGDAPYNGTFSGTGAGGTSFAAINDLLVVEVPMEFNFQAFKLPWQLFADVAVNTQGSDRSEAAVDAGAAPTGTDDENLAYQVGLQVGAAKNKGTWQVKGFWQHAEAFSLDPNLVDSDIYDSKLNLEGFAAQMAYAITDNIKATVTYAYGDVIEEDLGTGTGGDLTPNPLNDYQLLQLDLNWKF